jgi:hypothetical protein
MKKVHTLMIATALAVFFSHTGFTQASVAKETKILEQQLNLFSTPDTKQESKEKFEFDGCKCKYSYTSNDGSGFNMSKSNSFDLKEVSSVSYAKNDNNTYELRLKLRSEDNSITKVLDLSSINVNLNTTDEKQVKEIASRFKNVVTKCSGK